MPQVGARIHEIGRVQPGRSERLISRPVTSQTGYSRRFDIEFALRSSTNVDESTSPSRPSETIDATSATTNHAGWRKSSGRPKMRRPQSSVEGIEYSPIDAVATVIGSTTSISRGGTLITYSSVPCQRCHWMSPPEPNSTDDQMPIIPAPSDA